MTERYWAPRYAKIAERKARLKRDREDASSRLPSRRWGK